jgi:uncharacterized protein involved in exopolysaccharide biosynthesis
MNTASLEYNSDFSQENAKSIGDWIDAFRRRFKIFIITSSIILTIATVITFALPSLYKSTATILIEQQEIPKELVRSTVTSFADQRIEIISQTVMTRSNLLEIINKYNLYEDELKSEPVEVVLKEMSDNINKSIISADVIDPVSGRPTQASIAFTLSFKSESPVLAQKVASELTSLYLNENLKSRTEMANEAEIFLTEEAERLRQQIAELESHLAELKENHMNSMPELMDLNIKLMDRSEQELMEIDRKIQAIGERKIYLESELAQLSPNLPILSETGERILSPRDRLKTLESKLVVASAVYSADHPDVVRLRKEIDALKNDVSGKAPLFGNEIEANLTKARADLESLRGKYAEDHPDITRVKSQVIKLEETLASNGVDVEMPSAALESKPDNPAYSNLNAQLNAANSEISSLEQQKNKIRERFIEYEQRLTESPQVERQFRALARDYDNARLKYAEVKAKQMEAKLAKELETERKGERFTLIDPAQLPERPISPNRVALAVLGFILSIGAGLGLVFLFENMDQSIRGTKNVVVLLNTAPLAGIPYMEIEAEKKRSSVKKVAIATAIISGMMIALALVHFFKTPLDVLWYVALRRFGIDT